MEYGDKGSGRIAIIGGGPAGLAAAECLADLGISTDVYDAMPTLGRKFLLAGKSGLNLTHAEDYDRFVSRYGDDLPPALRRALDGFRPDAIRAWAAALGSETFVGSSGRVFPIAMKASPLLRAWLRRLDAMGVQIHVRQRWIGWTAGGALRFQTPEGERQIRPVATILALGGASWPRLGSDAAWVDLLATRRIEAAPLRPANCGFDVDWSDVFRDRHAGQPVKTVTATVDGRVVPGEFVVTRNGIEGSLVYAHSAALRDRLDSCLPAVLTLDLVPGRSVERLTGDLARPRGKASMATHLRKATGLDGVKAGLVRECLGEAIRADPARLAAALKSLPLTVSATRPIAEAISTAGGVRFSDLDEHLMLETLPGVFAAGEMLDWEAPTGGYLLTACLATGRAAAEGVAAYLEAR